MENFPNAMESWLFREFPCQIGKLHANLCCRAQLEIPRSWNHGVLEGLTSHMTKFDIALEIIRWSHHLLFEPLSLSQHESATRDGMKF